MGTALGATIDYLVTQLTTLAPAAVPGTLVIDAVTNDELSDNMIYVGRTDPDLMTAAEGNRVYPVLGARIATETFRVDGFIDCKTDGTNQKTVRDNAVALYDVLCHLIASDVTLGGILGSLWAEVQGVQLIQPDMALNAQSRAVITFTVAASNRYTP